MPPAGQSVYGVTRTIQLHITSFPGVVGLTVDVERSSVLVVNKLVKISPGAGTNAADGTNI